MDISHPGDIWGLSNIVILIRMGFSVRNLSSYKMIPTSFAVLNNIDIQLLQSFDE